jgi:hypothetical protein
MTAVATLAPRKGKQRLATPITGRLAAPTVTLRGAAVTGMPTSATQEVRVLAATFGPGDRKVFHSHR